jgi:hypothetical protein
MTDLAAQLRTLTERAAEPIGLEEAMTPPGDEATSLPPSPHRNGGRWSRVAIPAALLVFVAGLGGLIWSISRQPDTSRSSSTGTGVLYALPPIGAAKLQVMFPLDPPFEDTGTFTYEHPNLGPVQLQTGLTSTNGLSDSQAALESALDSGYDAISTDVQGFGTVIVVCLPPPPTSSGAVGEGDKLGHALIRWFGDGVFTSLSQYGADAGDCVASEEASALEQAMKDVRLVTRDEWQTYIEQNRTGEVRRPDTDTAPVPAKPGPAAWCDAVEALRGSGTIDSSSGNLTVEALSYLRTMLSEAPAEIAPPIQTLITWLESGAPTPKPAEVSAAESDSTQDWAERCPAG